jgi:hypothetical protein
MLLLRFHTLLLLGLGALLLKVLWLRPLWFHALLLLRAFLLKMLWLRTLWLHVFLLLLFHVLLAGLHTYRLFALLLHMRWLDALMLLYFLPEGWLLVLCR